MTNRVRLIRRYPPDEAKKPKEQRKRWVWVLRWTDGDGGRPQETIGYYREARDPWKPIRGADRRLTVKEAEQARDDKQEAIKNGTAAARPSPTARMPWAEFTATYIEATRGTMRDTSLKGLREALDTFGKIAEPKTPADVTAAMVKRFVQARRAEGRADATIKTHLNLLRRTWNDPATELSRTGNPFAAGRGTSRPMLKTESKEWHRYTPAELDSMLAATSDQWWRAFIFTAYTTGLRRGELSNLRWCDLDFERMELRVRSRPATDAEWAWMPKGKYRRTVPITSRAASMLKSMQVQAGGSPYVFVVGDRYAEVQRRRKAGRWHSLSQPLPWAWNEYRDILKAADVPADAFHSLRKSCITNWLEAGVPPHEVQAMAGHADLTTTMTYYAKVGGDAMRRVREASERYTREAVA